MERETPLTLMDWAPGHPENFDYYPVDGEPKNGFYPVRKGSGTYHWNGEKIVPKEGQADG